MNSSKSFGLTPQPCFRKMQIRKGGPVNHYYNGNCKLEVISERYTVQEWINKLKSLTIKNLLSLRIMCATSLTKILFCLQYLVRLHVYNLFNNYLLDFKSQLLDAWSFSVSLSVLSPYSLILLIPYVLHIQSFERLNLWI